jgi:hypothetical protein
MGADIVVLVSASLNEHFKLFLRVEDFSIQQVDSEH